MSFVWSSIMLASRHRPDANPAVIYGRAYSTQVAEPR